MSQNRNRNRKLLCGNGYRNRIVIIRLVIWKLLYLVSIPGSYVCNHVLFLLFTDYDVRLINIIITLCFLLNFFIYLSGHFLS